MQHAPNQLEFPPFSPRRPWIGADLQTLRNVLRVPRDHLAASSQRITIPMTDGTGDQLAAALHAPAGAGDRLVVLIHGLGGCEDSDYLRVTAAHLLSQGHRVLRLNLRGAGESRPTCKLQYHAGRTADLRDVLRGLLEQGIASRFFLIGYSLGGNMLLKFLAEHGSDFPIDGAASVSAPIDLQMACHRILDGRNVFYHMYLLRRIRRESLAEGAELSESERRAITAAKSIYEFDRDFVAPRNGYASAEEYYEENSAERFLSEISQPTLVVHALDDPWIPRVAYDRIDWQRRPNLIPLLAPGGGHVGFHGSASRLPWHDECIAAFLSTTVS